MTNYTQNSPSHAHINERHLTYWHAMNTPGYKNKPTLAEIQEYLREAYLGYVPLPLNVDNLAKSYGYFGGSFYKETIKKILSKQDLIFNLIPFMKEVSQKEHLNLTEFRRYILQPEEKMDAGTLKRKIHAYNQNALRVLDGIYEEPHLVIQALKSASKKQWGQRLATPPTNTHLLKATSKLNSEDFFKNGMHLAFLEIEPQIYGTLQNDGKDTGFKARQYLRLILDFELSLTVLQNQQRTAQKQTERKPEEPARPATPQKEVKKQASVPVQKSESKPENQKVVKPSISKVSLEVSEEGTPSIVEKIVKNELGYDAPINSLQVQRILDAADSILKEPTTGNAPADFLHSKHPSKKAEKLTLETMDLSSR